MGPSSIAAQALAISKALPDSTGPDDRLVKLSPYIRKVYAALPERPGGMTRPEIIEATGLPNGSVKQGIWELQRAGLVVGTRRPGGIFRSIGGCEMSNEINIEELEKLAKAAAPGPWRRQDFYSGCEKNGIDDSDGDVVCASYGSLRPKSFDFIAAANPSAVLALIDRVKKAEAERDALASKLAELEGQEPVAWMTAKRDMASFVNFHDDDLPLYARPVPADPVNAHLLTALIQCRDRFAFYVGHHLDKGDLEKAAENEKFVAIANDAIASAESAPKAGWLTDRECAMATSESAHVRSDDMLRIARAIETAVLRKNGIEVAE